MRRYGRYAIAIAVIAAAVVLSLRHGDQRAQERGASGSSQASSAEADHGAHVPLWLAAGGREIAGVVVLDDVPVAGATVRLVRQAVPGELSMIADGAGRFDFGPRPVGIYVVIAEKPGLTAALETIDLRDPTEDPGDLHLALHACEASLHGTVHDVAGGVVAKARIAWLEQEQFTQEQFAGPGTEADDAGHYELCVPVGWVRVAVKADSYARLVEGFGVYGRARHDFWISPEAIVRGRVIRAADRSPVGGATVELSNQQYPIASLTADEDGTFRFEGITPGRYELAAMADHLTIDRPIVVIAEVARPADHVECALVPAASISGTVVDRGGKPIAGAKLWSVHQGLGTRPPEHAITQQDGTFTIEHLLPGDYKLGVRDYEQVADPRIVKVADADVRGVVVRVDRLASISGRITRGGKLIDDAFVRADGSPDSGSPQVHSDHGGRYTLVGLAAGAYHVYAQSDRVGAFTHGPEVTVAAGEQKTGVDVELDLSGSIAGVVLDQNGAPVPGVSLQFSLLHGEDGGFATTADDGTFTVHGLSGGGDYLFEVTEHEHVPLRALDGKRFPPIAVHDGNTHITGVRIRVRVEHLAISGRVIDSGGGPIADARVDVAPDGGPVWRSATTITDVDGKFTIRELPAGTYLLHAVAGHGEQYEKNVSAGRGGIVIRIPDPGAIAGTLEGFDGPVEVIATAPVGWRNASAEVNGSAFIVRDLMPGEYRVTATSAIGRAAATTTVAAGATARVVLRQPPDGKIVVSAVDASHAPVADLTCNASSEDSDQMSVMARVDAAGTYVFEHVVAGGTLLRCWGAGVSAVAEDEVHVIAGQTSRLEMVVRPRVPDQQRNVGIALEDQLGSVLVSSVEPGGAADRAGLAAGDVLRDMELEGAHVGPTDSRDWLWWFENARGPSLKITLERDDKQFVVELALGDPQ